MTVRMSCLCCDVVGVSGVRNKKGMFFQARAFNQDVARRNRRGLCCLNQQETLGWAGSAQPISRRPRTWMRMRCY
jgi:hypothetical protein